MKAFLALEDGTIFTGESFGATGEITGEIVFNTGMTGYQEVLTDPSYCGQIVTMTYPLIGNYGINDEDLESGKPQVKGFIVRELCKTPSNFRSSGTLNEYLKKNMIIGIEGIDTRELTKRLRDCGTMKGVISTKADFDIKDYIDEIKAYEIKNPVMNVTTKEIEHFPGSGLKVALIDYGLKRNIIRSLLKRDCDVYVFPAYTSAKEILASNPDGIMLSNGPGDPKDCEFEIKTIKELQGKVPVFGICLGHQLAALANGADTEKLKYGHRGCNHPVKDKKKDRTYITSQNHGFAVVLKSLDSRYMEASHINMNDNTVEGVRYKNVPMFTVQFHPEASPGPADTAYLFDEFIEMMKDFKNNQQLGDLRNA